ncbi:hypothetical protein Pmani_029290 [Petrolisthes manimaculis]|uniref:Uncharacterized protein n=1 Tax=Petrolisthes manimaculis TaxID=1843537 RepID=A0AAE1P061_9EUCA|nr:hypothetical protein Pmani_029290 [Petrolisthes manimaculis]
MAVDQVVKVYKSGARAEVSVQSYNMKPQVLSVLVVVLAAAAWAEPIKGGYGGGGGKGGGKGGYGDDDYHYDPGFEAYAPVVTYQAVKVKKPTIVHEEVIEHHPHIVKKPIKVHTAPAPILVQKPVTTYVKEWKLVTVPKTTYQQVWVHKIPIHQDSGKGKDHCPSSFTYKTTSFPPECDVPPPPP